MAGSEGVLAELLARSHRVSAREIPVLISEAGRRLGLTGALVYVADLQQRQLLVLPHAPGGPDEEALGIDSSVGGLAYRVQQVQQPRNGGTAWVPMIDGVERVGVMRVTAPVLTPQLLEASRALAGLATLLIMSKAPYMDLLVARERSRAMTLQAELLWAFLPPRTIGTESVTSSAVLEPAYEIGGDAFDHNLTNGSLHLTLLDAMGHDLASGGASAAGLAACRATRRSGGGLADIATTIDRTLDQWIPGRLMTAVIADLDTTTGRFAWINCGHPAPLLIRDGHVLPHVLERAPQLPLGLGFHRDAPPTRHHERLQPGDRVLIYSDGVTEARAPDGSLFGERRLADTVIRSMAAGESAPEALRRLVEVLLRHEDHLLRDDATILLVEWHPS
ncbi:serine/threonine-protein phosphatase [Streptomyces bambusae]|uniref:PP2C family protein-serine/threonine phosphatase n=1 Tax=Streptomyces bambusae TaxID=1550616 RepID=UPI001CFF866B|nr:PP2C family protein-serine/threonine phosphatase [Streptomyces bambusae]MCB5169148.1 serine/threonine-protein phosphatase [Streptomyces bambusae]